MTPMAAFVVGAAVPRAIRPEVLTFLAVAFLGGLVVVYFGFRNYTFGRTVRDTPPEPARSVAMGRTEVEGETVPAGTVFDRPFTEGKCVYAEYEIQTYKDSDDDDGKEWTTTLQETVGAPFYVDDGTGRVYVDTGADPTYEISDDYYTEIVVDGDEAPPTPVEAFLDGEGSERFTTDVAGDETPLQQLLGDDEDGARTPGTASESDGDDVGPRHVTRDELGNVGATGRDRRYYQRVLPVGERTYVFGGAVPSDGVEGASARLEGDPVTGELVISDRGAFELATGYTKRSLMYISAGIVASVMLLAVLSYVLLVGPVYGPEVAMP